MVGNEISAMDDADHAIYRIQKRLLTTPVEEIPLIELRDIVATTKQLLARQDERKTSYLYTLSLIAKAEIVRRLSDMALSDSPVFETTTPACWSCDIWRKAFLAETSKAGVRQGV